LVVTFKEAMPIVLAFRNENLEENHWADIKGLIQKDFDVLSPEFTLKSLIELDVNQFAEDIQGISTAASQEFRLRSDLKAELDRWNTIYFNIEHEDACDSLILKDVDEIYQVVDESLANINQILGNRFVKPLRPEAEKFKREIITLNDILDEWVLCQKNWRYL